MFVIEFSYAIWSQLSIQVYLLSFTVIVLSIFVTFIINYINQLIVDTNYKFNNYVK